MFNVLHFFIICTKSSELSDLAELLFDRHEGDMPSSVANEFVFMLNVLHNITYCYHVLVHLTWSFTITFFHLQSSLKCTAQ